MGGIMETQTALHTSDLVRDILPYGLVLLDAEWKYTFVNKSAEKLLGFSSRDVVGGDIWEAMSHGFGPLFLPAYENAKRENKLIDVEEYYPHVDRWILHRATPIENGVAVFLSDITEHKAGQLHFEAHKKNVRELLRQLPCMTYVCRGDADFTLSYVSEGCLKLFGIHAQAVVADRKRYYYNRILPEDFTQVRERWVRELRSNGSVQVEYRIRHKEGNLLWVREHAVVVHNTAGEIESVEGVVFDITEQKNNEELAQYLKRHDRLTGLYNRMFFEEERRRLDRTEHLPLAVVISDINGLKMINDALGEHVGDTLIRKTAELLRSTLGPNDIIGRIGGDEFGILLPNHDQPAADAYVQRIRSVIAEYNRQVNNDLLGINLSIGYAVKDLPDILIDSTFKLADDYLGKRKLLEKKSYHSSIVQSIKTTMNERSQETDEHAERLIKLTKSMGQILNLPQMELNELELFSTLHDIGKIGVPDGILNKPGKLTDEEWMQMRRHSEIGYRIAMSSPDLMQIADYILTHHERWDGSGYPRGIAGNEIPLPSRILAVADAFDAMTQDRVYRKAMYHEQAVEEIKRNSGTQFDPDVVGAFLRYLAKQKD